MEAAAPLAGRVLGEPAGSFVVVEWRDPGGPPDPPRLIAPLHVHHEDDEAWYVLEGVLRFQLGDDVVEAPAGSAVFAPRGLAHTFWNPSTEPTRYLLVMTRGIHRLIEEIHATPDRDAETMRRIFQKYGSQILG